jgi:phytoene dehydrogenase-like protein
VLHTGLGPESAYSAMAKVIAFAIEVAGCPIAVGGARSLLGAFERLITDQGGAIRTGAEAVAVVPGPGGRASGVRLADGETVVARKGVICSTTPQQLYGTLLAVGAAASRGGGRIAEISLRQGQHADAYALSAPPRWRGDPDLGKVALLHLTPGLDGVSRAANEAERGLLPAEPTICVGQPAALDPTRAPPGAAILWLLWPLVFRRQLVIHTIHLGAAALSK